MKELNQVYKDRGREFVNNLLDDYLIVTEKLSGSSFSFERDGFDLVFYKGNGARRINQVDRTMMMYYEGPIDYLERATADIMVTIPENWIFCFQYFVHNEPGVVKYDELPKNNLVLTHILVKGLGGKVAKVIDDPRVINDWANVLDVTAIRPFFMGRLSEDQKKKVREFVALPVDDQEAAFGTDSFVQYLLSILDNGVNRTTLQTSLRKPIDSLVFKFVKPGGDTAFSAKVVDPYTRHIMKSKAPVDLKRMPKDINEILLLDFLAFVEERGIKSADVMSSEPDKRYIELISSLFKDYVKDRGESIKDMDFEKADFAKGDEFNLNTAAINNEDTKKLVDSNDAYSSLYKILLGSLRKHRKKPGSVMTPTVVKDFNNMVDKIQNITGKAKQDDTIKTFSDYLGLKAIDESDKKGLDEMIMEEYIHSYDEFITEALRVPHKEQGKKPVNVFVGRFQPFTNGHVKVFEALHRKNGLPVVVMTVRSGKVDDRRPFSEQDQQALFAKLQRQYPFLEAMHILPNAAIDSVFASVRPAYEPVLWGYGSDRKASYEGMINKPTYREQLGVTDEFKGYEIPRSGQAVSATQVRDALKRDDEKMYRKLTPKSLHDSYDYLKTILSPVVAEDIEEDFDPEVRVINEGTERNYMVLAQSSRKEDKDKLYDMINKDLFGGKAPFQRVSIKNFSNGTISQVDRLLKSNPSAATRLANLGADVTGIGRGEIMLAYIIENCGIGGGSQDIDLTLYNQRGGVLDQSELKEARLGKDGYFSDWRTGAKHRPYVNAAKDDLQALYKALKDVLPELDPKTPVGADIQSKMARGEGAAFIKLVRDMDPVAVAAPLRFEVQVTPDGELVISKEGGDAVGNLSNKTTLNTLKQLLSTQNKQSYKSFKDIEAELAAGFGSIIEKFVFVQTDSAKRFKGVYFKNNLSSDPNETKIVSLTGGTVKVKVKA